MKSASIIIIFALLFSYTANSQTADSCSSNLILSARIPFDTSSLTCQSVWDSQNFILRYGQTAPSLWSFILSAPNTNSYVAMGFSPSGGMVGSTAIVGWVMNDGTSMMVKYFLGGQTPNQVQRYQGNLQIASNGTTIVSESSRIYMIFQLETSRPEKQQVYAVGPAGRLPSSPDFQLAEHGDKIATSIINYASGHNNQKKYPYPNMRKSHWMLYMLGLVK